MGGLKGLGGKVTHTMWTAPTWKEGGRGGERENGQVLRREEEKKKRKGGSAYYLMGREEGRERDGGGIFSQKGLRIR